MVLALVRRWLKFSPHVHLRENRVTDLMSFVKLVDRFIDDQMEYPLEWDDFISCKNDNPNIEAIRDRIANLEPLFFSKSEGSRETAINVLLEERNKAASLVSLPVRDLHRPSP